MTKGQLVERKGFVMQEEKASYVQKMMKMVLKR